MNTMNESAFSPSALGIPIGFFLIGLVLLWFMIGTRGWWWVKTLFIGVVLLFGIMVWGSINTYLGWPSRAELPPKFLVHWATVNEPKDGDDGGIFLWLLPLEKAPETPIITGFNIDSLNYQSTMTEPRAYRIAYSKERHKQVQQMVQQLKKGQPFIGGTKAGTGKGKGKGKGKGDGKGDGQGLGLEGKGKGEGQNGAWSFSWQSKDFYLGPLPPPKIPNKIENY